MGAHNALQNGRLRILQLFVDGWDFVWNAAEWCTIQKFIFFVLFCELTNAFITSLHLPSLFTNKRAVLSSAQTDQSQFSFPAGFRYEIKHALYLAEVSGTRKKWQTDRLTGTRNKCQKLARVSSLLKYKVTQCLTCSCVFKSSMLFISSCSRCSNLLASFLHFAVSSEICRSRPS